MEKASESHMCLSSSTNNSHIDRGGKDSLKTRLIQAAQLNESLPPTNS